MTSVTIEPEKFSDQSVHSPWLEDRVEKVRLSICMATYNRAKFIGETIDSILNQMEPGVELLIVDGASPDNTEEIVSRYVKSNSNIRYIRENVNSGIDGDYDKAVLYAKGEYCWLMTDDDLLKPGAIRAVIDAIDDKYDLLILNSEVWNSDYSALLTQRFATVNVDREYCAKDIDRLFVDAAGPLSFIGCVVIRRFLWVSRSRVPYYGTLFVHFGVIFQPPVLSSVLLIADPLISIRYGNAMWTPRGFEIWMFKWPQLIWSFTHIAESSRLAACVPEPWRQFRKLLLYRAIGGYGLEEYRNFLAAKALGFGKVMPFFVAKIPARFANAMASIYCLLFARHARANVYDLVRSVNSTWASQTVAHVLGIGRK